MAKQVNRTNGNNQSKGTKVMSKDDNTSITINGHTFTVAVVRRALFEGYTIATSDGAFSRKLGDMSRTSMVNGLTHRTGKPIHALMEECSSEPYSLRKEGKLDDAGFTKALAAKRDNMWDAMQGDDWGVPRGEGGGKKKKLSPEQSWFLTFAGQRTTDALVARGFESQTVKKVVSWKHPDGKFYPLSWWIDDYLGSAKPASPEGRKEYGESVKTKGDERRAEINAMVTQKMAQIRRESEREAKERAARVEAMKSAAPKNGGEKFEGL